jgi:hypothetical protein
MAAQYDPETGRLREPPRRFDRDDLRLVGFFVAAVVAILVLSAVLGVAVRIFLATSGLR